MIKHFLVSAILFIAVISSNTALAQNNSKEYRIEHLADSYSNVKINIHFIGLTEEDKVLTYNKVNSLGDVSDVHWRSASLLLVEASDNRVINIINGIFMEYGYKLIAQ